MPCGCDRLTARNPIGSARDAASASRTAALVSASNSRTGSYSAWSGRAPGSASSRVEVDLAHTRREFGEQAHHQRGVHWPESCRPNTKSLQRMPARRSWKRSHAATAAAARSRAAARAGECVQRARRAATARAGAASRAGRNRARSAGSAASTVGCRCMWLWASTWSSAQAGRAKASNCARISAASWRRARQEEGRSRPDRSASKSARPPDLAPRRAGAAAGPRPAPGGARRAARIAPRALDRVRSGGRAHHETGRGEHAAAVGLLDRLVDGQRQAEVVAGEDHARARSGAGRTSSGRASGRSRPPLQVVLRRANSAATQAASPARSRSGSSASARSPSRSRSPQPRISAALARRTSTAREHTEPERVGAAQRREQQRERQRALDDGRREAAAGFAAQVFWSQ